jgi:NADH-quinone oxidoreductase subunit C
VTAETRTEEPAAVAALRARRPDAVREVAINRGQPLVHVERDAVTDFLAFLRDDPALRFDFLVDVTAVDHWPATPRFRVLWVMRSMTRREEIVLSCRIEEDDARVPTASGLFACAESLERECYDMFGIHFDGHPDLRRILMPEVFTDFPMRRDFPMQGKMSDQEWAEWIISRAQRTEGDA